MYRQILNKKRGDARGFTLIELLVVIAVIGILSAIVLASLNEARQRGETSATIQQVKQYITAVELSYAPGGNEYPAPVIGSAKVQDCNGGSSCWKSGSGNLRSNYWRCFADTTGSGQCNIGTAAVATMADTSAYQDEEYIAITAATLNPPIRWTQGSPRVMDSYLFHGTDSRFAILYALPYDFTDPAECGIGGTRIPTSFSEIPGVGSDPDGVTFCIYESE